YHKAYGKDTSGVVYPPRCYVWDPNGADIPPWPSEILVGGLSGAPVGDLNGDGRLDFITLSVGPFIRAYDFATGELLWKFPITGYSSGMIGFYDMDGDLSPEVVFWDTGTWENPSDSVYILHAVDGDGAELPGWPVTLPGRMTVLVSPIPNTTFFLGDPDADGEAEIVLWIGRADRNFCDQVYMVNARGQVEPGWPITMGDELPDPKMAEIVESGMGADLNGDGYQEIVLKVAVMKSASSDTITLYPDTSEYYNYIWVLDHGGNILPGWPKEVISFFRLRLGDVTGDGLPEILAITHDAMGNYFLEAYDHVGNLLIVSDMIPVPDMGIWGPAVADLDGDDVGDLVIPLGANSKPRADGVEIMETSPILSGGLVAWSPLNGFLWGVNLRYVAEDPEPFPIHMCMGTLAFPILFDIDGNGLAEIFTHVGEYIAKTGGCPAIAYTLQSFYVLELSEPAKMMWPMPFHDNWNTNNYDFWPQNPAFTPAHETSPKPGASVSLAQNPTRGKVAVLMKLSGEQSVIIKAYDPTGRLVKSADFGKLGFGEHRLEMPIEPGVYFISVETDDEQKTIKALVR
ncbi:MAG: T9SS type A sorting domain-containing protein, partial [candidate division WOR-3 bacterium]